MNSIIHRVSQVIYKGYIEYIGGTFWDINFCGKVVVFLKKDL